MTFPGYVAPTLALIDAGVMHVGPTPAGMGATRGGLRFDPGRELRHIDFDGKRSDIAGLHRVTSYDPKLSGNMIEFSQAAVGRYEPGHASAESGSDMVFTPIAADQFLVAGDYLRHVTWTGRLQDNKAARVKFDWALVRKYTMTTTDKGEVAVEIEIVGVLAPGETNLSKCPYTIEYLNVVS